MKKSYQFGRTMLETISVLALIGVLGITGIYMYAKGADSVRADKIIKDVLVRASQKNSNDELNDMGTKKKVFVPEYGKSSKTAEGIKKDYKMIGSYGYAFDILESAPSAPGVVVVKVGQVSGNGKEIEPSICRAIKGKLTSYDSNGTARIECVHTSEPGNIENCSGSTDIISNPCPTDAVNALYFIVKFGEVSKVRPSSPGGSTPTPTPVGGCPPGSSESGFGDVVEGSSCRCLVASAHWTGSHCVICDENEVWNSVSKECKVNCPAGSSVLGTGDVTSNSSCQCDEPNTRWYINSCLSPCAVGTSINGEGGEVSGGCKCQYAGHYWNSVERNCQPCPVGSSIEGLGGVVSGMNFCRCEGAIATWSSRLGQCVVACSGDKVSNADGTMCVCWDGMIEKNGNPDRCVECNSDGDCNGGDICLNNFCENQNDCSHGICQTCDPLTQARTNLPSGTACESAGVAGLCDGNGICYPRERDTCNGLGSCPEGQFCNYGGTVESGGNQRGRFGKTPNVCQKVNPKRYLYTDIETNKKIVFYYNSKKDLKSWCRAADNVPNCTWEYLAYYGAKDWCRSLGARLLTNAQFKKYETVLKGFLPKTVGNGYSYWVDGGAYNPNSSNAYSGRLDGYVQTGGVVCWEEEEV